MNDGLKVQQFHTAAYREEVLRRSSRAVFEKKVSDLFEAACPWILSLSTVTVMWLAFFGA